jgi:AhpD family alkylhydroperoxidase
MLVHLRASQINGCSYCVELHSRELRDAGEPDDKIATVAAWREAPYFSGSERAALALTEARRDLGRGGALLRRDAARFAGRLDHDDQRLEHAERDDAAAGRLLRRRARLRGGGEQRLAALQVAARVDRTPERARALELRARLREAALLDQPLAAPEPRLRSD